MKNSIGAIYELPLDNAHHDNSPFNAHLFDRIGILVLLLTAHRDKLLGS